MLCDICKKNQASIHIKEIHGNQSKNINLCAECAAQKEKNGEFPGFPGFPGFNISEMLFNLGKLSDSLGPEARREAIDTENLLVCPRCRWTLEKLKSTGGRLGCAECYKTFGYLIEDALKNVHRGTVHTGKKIKGDKQPEGYVTELEELRRQLERAVAGEEFEQAALLRDRINILKKSVEDNK